VFAKQDYPQEWNICQNYLEDAYQQYVDSLKQYAGKIPEELATEEAIEQHKIAAYWEGWNIYIEMDIENKS
jgi:hypothetical protein